MAPSSTVRNGRRPEIRPVGDLLPQRLVITLVGCYVREDLRPVWAGGLVQILEGFGFSTAAARVTLTRLVARNLLARERSGRLVFYRPTRRSLGLIREGDRRIFALGEPPAPDEDWTIVWYSLPHDARMARHRISRRLRFLGFGPIEDSTWLCPRDEVDDVRRVMQELDADAHGAAFRARPDSFSDLESIVRRAWDLPRLSELYREFVDAFAPYRGRAAELDDEQAFRVRTLMTDAYWQFPFLDPDLPERLLPAGWLRDEARATFHELFSDLAEPSQRHFDAVARPASVPR